MHLKRLSKAVAVTVVVTMTTPAVVMADGVVAIETESNESAGETTAAGGASSESAPGAPATPDTSMTPETPAAPDTPVTPDVPVNPDTPDVPVNPDNPDVPVNPDDPENPDVPVNPDDPENPDVPVNPDDPENPDVPVNPDDPDNPENPETPENPEKPSEPENPDKKDEKETENKEAENTNSYSSLIGSQQTYVMPDIKEDFRFRTIRKVYGFALENLNIYEDKSESSRTVGTLEKDGVCYLLSNDGLKLHMDESEDTDTDDGTWVYVESGTVRGFALKAKLLTGDAAQEKADAKAKEKLEAQEAAEARAKEEQEAADAKAKEEQEAQKAAESGAESDEAANEADSTETEADSTETGETKVDITAASGLLANQTKETEDTKAEENITVEDFKEAKELVAPLENGAFLYTKTTVRTTVVEKDYAVGTALVSSIHESKNENSRVIGNLNKDNICFVLSDKDKDWVYVESGDVRGFIKKSTILLDEAAQKFVDEKGEENLQTASELIKPEDNKACYYTITSVKGGVPGGALRQSILEFASQFVGNAYVWGGTSLTNGADCSGFVQSIYAQYGYSLPRVAQDQAYYGTQIAVEDAMPGDLIFYANGSEIYHVVMYAGDGKTVEAANSRAGIIVGNVNTANAVWATRVLDDTYGFYGSDIAEVNASASQYGENLGTYKITHYCGGSCCNDQWAGVTSTGAPMVEGDTIAVDPTVIPYGTKVIINGHIFTASGCGGAIKGNRIDVYVNDHNRGNNLGVYYTNVYLLK